MQSSHPPPDVAYVLSYAKKNGVPSPAKFGRWWKEVDWQLLGLLSESPQAAVVLICLVDGSIRGSAEEIGEQINLVTMAAMMELNRRAGIAEVVGYGRCPAWRPAFLRNVKVRLAADLASIAHGKAYYQASVEKWNRAYPGFEFPMSDIMAIYDESSQ